MTIAIWKPGRRLFSCAAILMILLAIGHTVGFFGGGPPGPAEERLLADMGALRNPLGLGMSPSVKDIHYDFAWSVTITFAALGLINLTLAAFPETPYRLLRCVTWLNVLWVAAFLTLSWIFRIPPPLIFSAALEALLVASLFPRYDESRSERKT